MNRQPMLRSFQCATALGLIFSLAGVVDAHAQAAATAGAQASASGEEEIIVTARRREERLQTAPFSASAFGQVKLQQMNVNALSDLATAVPNLSITKQGAYPNAIIPAIRGISESDTVLTNDAPISIYLDGVLIARDVGANLDLGEIDRVEVDRGPQGTLFGRNTTGGAISVFTKRPADDFGISQKVGYGSDNELTTRTVFDTGTIGNTGLKARLTYSHHQMDGFITNTYDGPSLQPGHPVYVDGPSKWPGADDSHAIQFVLHGDIADNFSFDYRFDYTHDSAVPTGWQTTVATPNTIAYFGASPRFGGDPYVVAPGFLSTQRVSDAGGDPRNISEPMGNSLTLDYAFSDALDVKSITAIRSLNFQDYSSLTGQGNLRGLVLDPVTFVPSVQQVTPYSVICHANGTKSCSDEHQNQVSEEVQASGDVGSFKYVAGLYYFTEHVGNIDPQFVDFPLAGGVVAFPSPILNHYTGKSTTYALFSEVTYRPEMFNDDLELTGGFRYTRDEKAVHIFPTVSDQELIASKRGNAPSGDFTLKYQWTSDLMTYFRYANGYRSGGYNGRQDKNPAGYGPETADSFEWGAKSEFFDKRIRLNADLFYTVYDNKQVTSFVPVNGSPVSNTVNVGSATYLGGELDATFAPDQNWLIDFSFGYTSPSYDGYKVGENINGVTTVMDITDIAKFAYFSKASMNIGIQYTFDPMSIGDLAIRVNYGYKSGQVNSPDPISSPFDDQIASSNLNDVSLHVTLAHIPSPLERGDLTAEFYGNNLLNQHWREQGIDFGYFADNTYNRPINFGFVLTAKY